MTRRSLSVLAVNACLRRGSETKLLPIGLASVMTYLSERGFSVDLLDIDLDDLDDGAVRAALGDRTFDVLLVGSIVTHYRWIKWLVRTVKQDRPEAFVVVGNSVGSSCPEVFLANAPADAVVIGEGEVTAAELLEALDEGRAWRSIPGLAYRDIDGCVRRTARRTAAPIDSFPMIDWSPFEVERYLQRCCAVTCGEGDLRRAMPVITARGCAFRCTFCHFVFWNDPYRHRDPSSVLAEVRRNVEVHGADYVNFWDDLTFASVPQAESLVDAIEESGLDFRWMAAVRTDLFGHPRTSRKRRECLATRMREAGCSALGFSLESADEEILTAMNKKVEPEYFSEQIEILRAAGITCNTSVVFGYPQETPDTIRRTFELCARNRVYPSIGFLMPLPATEMYEYARREGYITDEDHYLDSLTERQDIGLNMTEMSDEEILSEITAGARRLNELLGLGLADDSFVRTGGYKRHTAKRLERNENDFTFNYSESVFEVDAGR